MTKSGEVPSVWAIRESLESVPGAIRGEPLVEDAREGADPATAVPISDPGYLTDAPTLSPPDDDADLDSPADEPAVAFEVPPSVTDADIAEVLGEQEFTQIKRLYQERGVDALGWYVTFHQRIAQHGIFIPFEGVLLFASQAFPQFNVPLNRKLAFAFHAILRHELFHFSADCMLANMELTTGTSVYWPGRTRMRNAAGYVELEEGLANAYMLRGFKHPSRTLIDSRGGYEHLKEFCRRQPAGYIDGPEIAKSRQSYIGASRRLAAGLQHASQSEWKIPSPLDTLLFYPNPVRIDWTRCPIIFFDRHGLQKKLGIYLEYFRAIEKIKETPQFLKELDDVDTRIRNTWEKRKALLARSTSFSSLDFQIWSKAGPDVYSVRVDGNFRVHLRREGQDQWSAIAIGNHKKLGHG